MILENVKVRLSEIKNDIDFIKECLWQGGLKSAVRRTQKTATCRWLLSWPSKSYGSKQKNKGYWKQTWFN